MLEQVADGIQCFLWWRPDNCLLQLQRALENSWWLRYSAVVWFVFAVCWSFSQADSLLPVLLLIARCARACALLRNAICTKNRHFLVVCDNFIVKIISREHRKLNFFSAKFAPDHELYNTKISIRKASWEVREPIVGLIQFGPTN